MIMNTISELEKLNARIISELEAENKRLKSLLDQAGIAYPPAEKNTESEAAVQPAGITVHLARRFYSFFWGRTDVFAKRSANKKTGKSGYYTQCGNFWLHGICPKTSGQKQKCSGCPNRVWTKLEAEHIAAHLRGEKEDASDMIGIYPLFPDGTCRFLVFDFDDHNAAEKSDKLSADTAEWKEEADTLRAICRHEQIPCLAERSRSGNGAHIWILFSEPVDASLTRKFGFALLDKGAESVNQKSFRTYDRMIPAQGALRDGELGNLIALPLQGQALKAGNSAFVDENWRPYPDQWEALFRTEKLSRRPVEDRIAAWNQPISAPDSLDSLKPWERSMRFHRDDCDGPLRIVRANLVYVESGNLKPRLQNQIRRLAAFSNPVFFRNQAIGCPITQTEGLSTSAKTIPAISASPADWTNPSRKNAGTPGSP